MYRLRIHEALCRSFFPAVEQRLKMRIPITPEFTAIVTGHGNTKYYLHRFKIPEKAICPCNEGMQTSEHIIYVCNIMQSQRSSLIKHITARRGDRLNTNCELLANYLNVFLRFMKYIGFNKVHTTRTKLVILC
jgi:hypothetical protein